MSDSTDSVIGILQRITAEKLSTLVQATITAVKAFNSICAHANSASWSLGIEHPPLVDTLLILLQLIVRESGGHQIFVALLTFYPIISVRGPAHD
jgi:hypothetical protein